MKKYIYNIRFFVIIQIISAALASIALAVIPILQKEFFDSISNGKDISFKMFILLYFSCIVASMLLSYINMLVTWKGGICFEMALKTDFFKAISNYSYKRFSSKDVGEYISLQGNEISELETSYLSSIINIIKAINALIIYGVTLFVFVDWRIAVVISVISIFSAVVVPKFTSMELAKRQKEYLDNMGKYVSKITDLLEGFKLIQSTTKDNIIYEHEKILENTSKKRFHYGKMRTLSIIINGGSTYLLEISALSLVGYLYLKGKISIGTGIAALTCINSFNGPIEEIMYNTSSINSTKEIKKKVLEFLKIEPLEDSIYKNEFNSHIELRNIGVQFESFSMKNLSFTFEKGKKYAIIGHSGSGKSTIVRALMKYVELSNGEILIDGENINKIDTSNIICCINQKEHIYDGSFMDNATIFSSYSNRGIHRVKGIVEKKMMDSINEKEDCKLLSGGEKQIIGITRMDLSDAPIYILDESFSAIDMNTTKRLNDFVMSMDDKTIIMVTHKLSPQLSEFDEIIHMECGKIIEKGTYEEISKSQEFNILQVQPTYCKNVII